MLIRLLCRLALAVLVAGFAPPLHAAAEERPDLIDVRKDDARMNKAIAEARRTLPQFLALLADPPPGVGEFTFKYPLAGWEHIWVERVARKGDALVGRLSDAPAEPGYRQGQRVTVPLAEISDWAYRDAQGVMQGHRTTRVLLPKLQPEQRRAVLQMFGWER